MRKKNDLLTPLDYPTASRFAFYHQNEALLFQFLMYECLRVHSILRKKPHPSLLPLIMGNLEINQGKWRAPSGHLPRLIHYCSLLELHFDAPEASYCRNLQTSLSRAFDAAKQFEHTEDGDEKTYEMLYALLRKEITLFFKTLLEKLPKFSDNPAILYFLLRHREQFDAIYRQPFIKKMFALFFPDGLEQALFFLTDKFAKKGFNHLIPAIEEALRQLAHDE